MTTCTRCDDTAGPFQLVDGEGWVHLRHMSPRHLVLVPDDPTPLEELLLASLADDGRLLLATHNALERNACDDVASGSVWPVEVPQ